MIVGSPVTVADRLQECVAEAGIDGFNLAYTVLPECFTEFVDLVVPARRDIAQGEELTIDYTMFEQDEAFVMPWSCRCGGASCRRTITGRDWRRPELQRRYRGRFSPFLNDRISRLGTG